MTKKQLSNVDLALLKMDSPNNLMVINGLMILGKRIDLKLLKETIEKRLLKYDRFRQRVIIPKMLFQRPYWQEDLQFDLDNHLIVIDLPMPEDQQLLQHLVSELMSIPLNPNRPLWQFYVVQNYGEGSALICRMHHAIADGMALMGVFLSLTDREAEGKNLPFIPLPTTHSAGDGKAFADQSKLARSQILRDPESVISVFQQGTDAFISMGRFVFRKSDPKTVLKGELGGHKRAVWAGPVPLDQVKRFGRAFGGTVNDVLLAMLSGALRQYLLDHGEALSKDHLHSFVPVNLRSPHSKQPLGNQFGVVFLSLPVGVADPVERLYRVITHMDELKSSNEAIATFGLFYLLGAVPCFQEAVLSIFDSKGTAVTTNVPGPQEQLFLAGSPIQTVMAWVPKSGHIGVGISIISYNGGVWIGISADEQLLPDPDKLVAYFCDEFELYESLAQERWARRRASVMPMFTMLDDALRTLDDVVSESVGRTQDQNSRTAGRCQGLTKAGKPCKNQAILGQNYCRVHQESERIVA